MADAPARRDHVVPEGALFLRPDAPDRRTRALIERIRLQLHAHTAEGFKGMPEQDVFGLAIHGRSLPGVSHPRPANLNALMRALDVSKAGAPDRPAGGPFQNGKRQRDAAFLFR